MVFRFGDAREKALDRALSMTCPVHNLQYTLKSMYFAIPPGSKADAHVAVCLGCIENANRLVRKAGFRTDY